MSAPPVPGREAKINDGLKQLSEQFHIGMVSPDEYRMRRRMLLDSWADRDVTTAPRRAPKAALLGGDDAPTAIIREAPPRRSPWRWAAIVAAVTGVALIYVFWPRPAASPAIGPAAPASQALPVVRQAAAELLAERRWEREDVERFLVLWRALSPGEQRLALQQPVMRSLRHEVQQNIRTEQLVEGAATDPVRLQRIETWNDLLRQLAAAET